MKKLSTLFILLISILSFNIKAQENAFVFDYLSGGLSYIDLATGNTTGVGSAMNNMGGADFGPDNVLYAINTTSNQLFSVDTSDATTTLIGSVTPPADHLWTGMAYDESTGIMYALCSYGIAAGSCKLYTVDLSDATLTLIGTQGDATALACIAIDDTGQMYGIQLYANPRLYMIDKTDASVTLVGTVNSFGGAGMGYGMDYDTETQTMFITAYDSFTFNNDLYTCDLATGACTSVGSNLSSWTSALAITNAFNCDFSADATLICTGTTVNFTNESTGADSFSWTFEGGTPSTSTDENPSVLYSTPGVYNVQLTITNSIGSTKTETKTDYITVLETPAKANTPVGEDGVCTASYYSYSIDEVEYTESYEWELSPADAGTLTSTGNSASLETADDWTGDFTIRVRATNMCGDGEWSDNFEGTLSQSPDEFALEGGGTYCLGTDGVEITLDGSQTGVDYELYLDGVSTGNVVAGTGSALSFGLVTDEGYYEAVGFNDNCTYTMQNQVEVSVAYPPLEPETPVGPETVCTEATSDYTSEGSEDADSYEWALAPEEAGTISFDVLSATVTWNSEFNGTATISLFGINDCGDGNPSELLEVSVGAPSPVVIGESMVCDFSDEIYEVANNEGSTYSWVVTGGTISEGQGTSMITVAWQGVGSGSVSVDEETADGCSGSSEEFAVEIDDCTGFEDIIFKNTITISPNPAIDRFTLTSVNELIEVSILQLGAQSIQTFKANGNKTEINTSHLRQGIYLLKVVTDQGITIKKLIIQ